ncbi:MULTISPECIES: serine hydrolase domain-containing protein [unclassified Sphingomonas]|uniref:serine hydrolase domain-containing protein n=1 Tax=unclassified Sphingomonas TaxID=196159 RepID=UPI000E7263A7|nr:MULTISPECIES: serine hydrolase domain-containing protein [unclassified Sphingomonas]RKE50152.1 CubicO group peptidase (beta-lactamase class C family) [Sphingomonas sp. PP-CC-1A-547]TCM08486.1 CubicO group peptidase (beta-lactamase class C family) [Sphingomonas sp. PP-CC-3G-468]
MKIAEPAAHGFAASRLAAIDTLLQTRYIDSGKLPNAQLLIARDGEIVHFSNAGAAREGGKSVDEGSLFRIASMTKPITSVAFMMLVEQGLVAVDTPVHHVLPEFKDIGVYDGGGGGVPFVTRPTAEPMRMVDLLRHTSGLTYSFQNRSNVDAAYREGKIEGWHGGYDLDGFIGALAKIPLEFSPGTAWNYSVATDVLGAVVQRVSGLPLDQFFRTRIFAPLKMDDTFFQVPADKFDRLTDCYTLAPGKGRVMYDRGAESAWSRQPKLVSGGGGLVSTALDYHRFNTMLLNGGELDGARILGRKTLDLMTQNHLPGKSDLAAMSKSLFSEAANAGTGFGLGFAITDDVAKTMVPGSKGEFYWGGMFSTAFFVDPVERLSMVFMTQLSPSSFYPIRRELKTMIYAAMT